MAKWHVCATRDASEDASAIVEAESELEAKDKFSDLNSDGALQWRPGESGSMDFNFYHCEPVDDDEPVGPERDEDQTAREAAIHLLLAAEHALQVYHGSDPALKELRAAVDKARGGLGGWCLIDHDGTGLKEIERDDETAIFDSDDEALAYVRKLAAAGDYEATCALMDHERDEEALAAYRAAQVKEESHA